MSPLIVLVAINILNFYDRYVLGALAEPIRREFQLSDTQIGLLGSIFIWLYAIVGIPLGRLADRRSRKILLACGIIVWTALTGIAAFASSYLMLLMSRLGFAVGEAVVAPAATSWIGDLYPAPQRSRALALFMLGVPVGGALTYFFSGPIAEAFGWRVAMVIAAAPAVVLIPLLLRMQEPRRGASDHQHGGTPARISMAAMLRIPTLWWIIASGATLNFNMYALGLFMPAFLSRIHHVSLAASGIGTGITYLIGGIAGSLFAGWLGDRVMQGRHNARLLWAAGFSLAGAPMAYLGILADDVRLAVVLITVFYGSLCAYYGFVYASIQDIVPSGMRAAAMAVYFMAMYLCGASFGPILTGKMSDMMAQRAAAAAASPTVTEAFRAVGLQQAMLIMPVLSVVLAVVLFMGSRTITADIANRSMAAGQAQPA